MGANSSFVEAGSSRKAFIITIIGDIAMNTSSIDQPDTQTAVLIFIAAGRRTESQMQNTVDC